MDQYTICKQVNSGAFGQVYKAVDNKSNQVVAIKKIHKKLFDFNPKNNNREIKALKNLNHPNLIQCMNLITKTNCIYFIFEYMEENLLEYLNNFNTKLIPLNCIQFITREVCQGLDYMHSNGYFHRDLKPENILLQGNRVKIADFGLCREVNQMKRLTKYVSTRWYRAPEVILGCKDYSCPIDIWALGCIISELILRKPLLPGDNEIDQLYKICCVIGRPDCINSLGGTWDLGVQLGLVMGYRFPSVGEPTLIHQLQLYYPDISNEMIHLILSTLQFDPLKRPKARDLLNHPCLVNFSNPMYDLKTPDFNQELDTSLPDLPPHSPMSNSWVGGDPYKSSPAISLSNSLQKKIKRQPNCFFDLYHPDKTHSNSSSNANTPNSSTRSPQLRRLSNIDSSQFAHARRLSTQFDYKINICQSEKLNRVSLYHSDKIGTRSLPRSFQPSRFDIDSNPKPPSLLCNLFQESLPPTQKERVKPTQMDKFDSLAQELIHLMEEKIDSIGTDTQYGGAMDGNPSSNEPSFLPNGLGLELFNVQ